MASNFGSTFQKGEVGVQITSLASSPLQVLLMKYLVWKISSKTCECMEVEISSNMKFLKSSSTQEEEKP